MKNQTGGIGEAFAAKQLRKKGYQILALNYRSRFGEIDIIAANKAYIIFVEVKTRKQAGLTDPYEAVTREKQQKIRRTAQMYLSANPTALQPRFDVAAVYTQNMRVVRFEILENAF